MPLNYVQIVIININVKRYGDSLISICFDGRGVFIVLMLKHGTGNI